MLTVGVLFDTDWSVALDEIVEMPQPSGLTVHRSWKLGDDIYVSDRLFALTNFKKLAVGKIPRLPHLAFLDRTHRLAPLEMVLNEQGIWIVLVPEPGRDDWVEALSQAIQSLAETVNKNTETK